MACIQIRLAHFLQYFYYWEDLVRSCGVRVFHALCPKILTTSRVSSIIITASTDMLECCARSEALLGFSNGRHRSTSCLRWNFHCTYRCIVSIRKHVPTQSWKRCSRLLGTFACLRGLVDYHTVYNIWILYQGVYQVIARWFGDLR